MTPYYCANTSQAFEINYSQECCNMGYHCTGECLDELLYDNNCYCDIDNLIPNCEPTSTTLSILMPFIVIFGFITFILLCYGLCNLIKNKIKPTYKYRPLLDSTQTFGQTYGHTYGTTAYKIPLSTTYTAPTFGYGNNINNISNTSNVANFNPNTDTGNHLL